MHLTRRRKTHRSREAGQAVVFVVLILGIFLLGALCFAFDFSNMWFHRQAAQTAADAACTAGAMDLLVDSQGGSTGHQGFTVGTAYSCTTTSTDTICTYAAKNGYDSNNAAPGNLVNVSFPASVNGVTTPPSSIAGTHPFIRVDVLDNVGTFFLGLLNGSRSQGVRAFATCGIVQATAPIPLVVLDPRAGDSNTLSVQGTPTISIYGGPQRSIEVDSGNSAAVNVGGSATIDLSLGGPNLSGSDLGTYGGPASAPGGFKAGTTGHWIAPAAPVSDPFAQIVAPAQPSYVGTTTSVTATTPGVFCPDPTGCTEYSPGYYASGISVKNFTAIFDPGIYYIKGGFFADSNSCLYPSGALGDGSGGTLFYFADSSSVNVTANSGKKCFAFNSTAGYASTTSLVNGVKCTGASTIPPNLPATLTGNVLLGPCRTPTGANVPTLCTPNCSINYGDPQGTSDPLGEQRGFLFFQNRAQNASTNPSWQGGGQTLLSGTMYFHECVISGSDAGTGCSTTSAYNDVFSLGGNSGSGTYVLGQIVADQISLGGTSGITMDLNPSSVYSVLKASLLQ